MTLKVTCIYLLIVLTFYKYVLIMFNKQNWCDKKLIARWGNNPVIYF